MKTDEQLKKENPALYHVARENGTEPRFSRDFTNLKADGVLHCAVCNAALFPASAKFDSKSGWPAFTDPVNKEAVKLIPDYTHGMTRTEVRCATCDAHLGHVWEQGAYGMKDENGKTCDYYCINGISLETD